MKKNLYSYLSLASYILGIVLVSSAFASEPSIGTDPWYLSYLLLTGFILVPIGIVLAFISDRKKPSWVGNLLMIIGVMLLMPVDFYWSLGDMGEGSSIALVILILALLGLIFKLFFGLTDKKRPT